jgi:outer membrane lipoprotein-sorting protein
MTRWIAATLLVPALLSPALAQDDEAEKLYRDMEKRIRTAKAFEVTFTYEAGQKKARGKLLVAQDNQARLEISGLFGGKPDTSFELVSDGKRLKTAGAKLSVMPSGLPVVEPGGQSEQPAPKNLHAALGATVSRGGLWFTVLVLPYLCGGQGGESFDPDGAESKMKVYDFKLAGAEKVGERDAKVLRYRFGKGDGCRDDEEITLWVDARTLLPLKRSFVLKIEGTRISEVYDAFTLDPKIDAGAFSLPK